MRKGFTQIYTGDGKGKTTAAMGLAVRASGAGLRICFIQFLKGRCVSEWAPLRCLPGLTLQCFGRIRFVQGESSARDRELARSGLDAVRTALASGIYDVIVADEICMAVRLGLIVEREVLDCIRSKPQAVELILTGRGAGAGLRAAADLVTEMRPVKHYFDRGIKARKGIEY